MRITCPSCAATYEVPDAVLRAGQRKMRCARCAHQWVPEEATPDGAAPAQPATATPMPAMVANVAVRPADLPDEGTGRPPAEPGLTRPTPTESRPTTPPRPVAPKLLSIYPPLVESGHIAHTPLHRHGGGLAAIGWVLTLSVLAALATGFVLDREQIEFAWPPSQRLYAALGL